MRKSMFFSSCCLFLNQSSPGGSAACDVPDIPPLLDAVWWSNDALLLLTAQRAVLLVAAAPSDHPMEQLLNPAPPPLDAAHAAVAPAARGAWVAWGRGTAWRVAKWAAVPPVQRVEALVLERRWDEAMATAEQLGVDTDVVLR